MKMILSALFLCLVFASGAHSKDELDTRITWKMSEVLGTCGGGYQALADLSEQTGLIDAKVSFRETRNGWVTASQLVGWALTEMDWKNAKEYAEARSESGKSYWMSRFRADLATNKKDDLTTEFSNACQPFLSLQKDLVQIAHSRIYGKQEDANIFSRRITDAVARWITTPNGAQWIIAFDAEGGRSR